MVNINMKGIKVMSKDQQEFMKTERRNELLNSLRSVLDPEIIDHAIRSGLSSKDFLGSNPLNRNLTTETNSFPLQGIGGNSKREEGGINQMSNSYTEEQRIKDLESIRTPKNGHIIDEAIKNGQVASHAAMETIKGGYLLSEDEIAQAHADAILVEISSMTAAVNAKQLAGKPKKAMTENERIDAAVAAIDWDNL